MGLSVFVKACTVLQTVSDRERAKVKWRSTLPLPSFLGVLLKCQIIFLLLSWLNYCKDQRTHNLSAKATSSLNHHNNFNDAPGVLCKNIILSINHLGRGDAKQRCSFAFVGLTQKWNHRHHYSSNTAVLSLGFILIKQ